MSATADFYQECADNDIVPLDRSTDCPDKYPRKHATIEARRGPVDVTGISIVDALHWANDGAPRWVVDFLACFHDAEECEDCGRYIFACQSDGHFC